MVSLRRIVARLLPWYDEQREDAETAKTDAAISRSVRHRERNERLLRVAFSGIDRRRDHVRADYRRFDERIAERRRR